MTRIFMLINDSLKETEVAHSAFRYSVGKKMNYLEIKFIYVWQNVNIKCYLNLKKLDIRKLL